MDKHLRPMTDLIEPTRLVDNGIHVVEVMLNLSRREHAATLGFVGPEFYEGKVPR